MNSIHENSQGSVETDVANASTTVRRTTDNRLPNANTTAGTPTTQFTFPQGPAADNNRVPSIDVQQAAVSRPHITPEEIIQLLSNVPEADRNGLLKAIVGEHTEVPKSQQSEPTKPADQLQTERKDRALDAAKNIMEISGSSTQFIDADEWKQTIMNLTKNCDFKGEEAIHFMSKVLHDLAWDWFRNNGYPGDFEERPLEYFVDTVVEHIKKVYNRDNAIRKIRNFCIKCGEDARLFRDIYQKFLKNVLSEEAIILFFRTSLDLVNNRLLATEPTLSLDEAVLWVKKALGDKSPLSTSTAFTSNDSSQFSEGDKNQKRPREDSQSQSCTFCKSINHDVDDCPVKGRIYQRKARQINTNNYNRDNNVSKDNNNDKGKNPQRPRGFKCNTCKTNDHAFRNCRRKRGKKK